MSEGRTDDKQEPFKAMASTEHNAVAPDYVLGPDGFKVQCYSAWETAQHLNRLFAKSAEVTIKEARVVPCDLCGCGTPGVYCAQSATAPTFLLNGTRFKLGFDSKGRTDVFWNYAKQLEGRWVALVPAEDDCHLKAQPTDSGSDNA